MAALDVWYYRTTVEGFESWTSQERVVGEVHWQTSQRARINGGDVGKGDARAAGYASAKTLNMRADSMVIRIRMWLTCSLIDP